MSHIPGEAIFDLLRFKWNTSQERMQNSSKIATQNLEGEIRYNSKVKTKSTYIYLGSSRCKSS